MEEVILLAELEIDLEYLMIEFFNLVQYLIPLPLLKA